MNSMGEQLNKGIAEKGGLRGEGSGLSQVGFTEIGQRKRESVRRITISSRILKG